MWIAKKLIPMDHSELHVKLKVRDGKVTLIEKTKIVKEKSEKEALQSQRRDPLVSIVRTQSDRMITRNIIMKWFNDVGHIKF